MIYEEKALTGRSHHPNHLVSLILLLWNPISTSPPALVHSIDDLVTISSATPVEEACKQLLELASSDQTSSQDFLVVHQDGDESKWKGIFDVSHLPLDITEKVVSICKLRLRWHLFGFASDVLRNHLLSYSLSIRFSIVFFPWCSLQLLLALLQLHVLALQRLLRIHLTIINLPWLRDGTFRFIKLQEPKAGRILLQTLLK